MLNLPPHLSASIENEINQAPVGDLVAAAEELSGFYREKQRNRVHLNRLHCLAYLAVRMPATFAVATTVCAHLPHKVSSLLDCGAGPGTILLAHSNLNHPVKKATLYEQERAFVDLGQQLLPPTKNLNVEWVNTNLKTHTSFDPHDVVSISYVLNELDPKNQQKLVTQAWGAATKSVVVIEPGTPQGFANLLRARQVLIDQGANIYAPCPHNLVCPMQATDDWCHFSVRLPRSPWHRRLKQATLAYEDEKYCYLIASRPALFQDLGSSKSPSRSSHTSQYAPAARSIFPAHILNYRRSKESGHEGATRVIKRPLKGSGHISLDLCTPIGLKRSIVSKRTKTSYAQARKVVWGDTWEEN